MGGIPDSFDVELTGNIGVGLGGGLAVDIRNIPTIHLAVDTLPDIHISIDRIPKVQLGLDPIEIRLTRLPDLRAHLPADFCVGLSVLGTELLNVRLCGEAQVITEPYRPNPCEECREAGIGHLRDDADLSHALSPALEEAA
jgi:hypothetical protein